MTEETPKNYNLEYVEPTGFFSKTRNIAIVGLALFGAEFAGLKYLVEYKGAEAQQAHNEAAAEKKAKLDKNVADPFNAVKDSTKQDSTQAPAKAAPAAKATAPKR